MLLGNHLDALSGFAFLKAVDLHDIGIVLMTSSLIVILFTYLGNEDAEAEAEECTRRASRLRRLPSYPASSVPWPIRPGRF